MVRAHLTDLHVLLRQQTFDLSLLTIGLGIILVDTHQPHAPKHAFHLFGIIHLDVVHIVFAHGWRQDVLTEVRLLDTLSANEHGYHRVAVVAIDVERLRHHRQEPAMEVFGPLLVVGGQTTGEVLDIVRLAVPLATTCQEFVDRIVVVDVGRLDIDADVVHPALATLLHLFHDNRFQLTISEGFPRFKGEVVWTEFCDLLHHIVAQLIATGEKILDETDDALLLVHLRERPSVVGLLIGFTKHLTDDIQSKLAETMVPMGAHNAGLFLQSCFLTVARQRHQTMFVAFRLVIQCLRQTGVILHLNALAFVVVGIPDDLSVIVCLRTLVCCQHAALVVDDWQRHGVGVVIQLWVVTHATAPHQRLFAHYHVTHHQVHIKARGRFVGLLQECQIDIAVQRILTS